MKAEDFDKASIKELQALADKCFKAAQSPLEEVEISGFYAEPSPRILDDPAKLRLLLEAQFYLTDVARKRDEEVATRDRKLEIWVIILIGVEILLSLIGIGLTIYEGRQQGRVLSNIEKSTSDSAGAMSAARTLLESLSASQTASLDHLKQMDSNLQSSQKLTGAMASATRNQLQILAQEQADRQAQLAKKPSLRLYIDNAPLSGMTFSFKPRTETDTSVSFDFSLVNEGSAVATKPLMRVIVGNKFVSLTSTTRVERPVESPDSPIHVFLLPLDDLRSRVSIPMTLTFTYPAETKSFGVSFNIDANEIETGTPLGSINLTPRHFPIR